MTGTTDTVRSLPLGINPARLYRAGWEGERARIVAWLRGMADNTHSQSRRDEWRHAADSIERGDHEEVTA
jgi:hypothetical protein